MGTPVVAIKPGIDPALAAVLRPDELLRGRPSIWDEKDADRGPINGADWIRAYQPPEYLWDGVLHKSILAALTGHSGGGKTAFGVPFAVSAALGRDLAGRAMQPGRVVYVAAENPHDVQTRLVGTAQAIGIDPEALRDNLFILAGPRGASFLLGELDRLAADEGDLSLVVIDTSAAVFEGEDENSNVEAQRHAEALRRINSLPGKPTALVLMHPRHGATRDNLIPRGASALLAALDANFTIWKGDDDVVELGFTKLRGAPFDPLLFDLVRYELSGYLDSRGRPVTAGIALPNSSSHDGELKRRREHIDAGNLVLRKVKAHGYTSMVDLARQCLWIGPDGQAQKWKAQRALERLEKDRLVEKWRDGYRLTKPGEREAEKLGGLV